MMTKFHQSYVELSALLNGVFCYIHRAYLRGEDKSFEHRCSNGLIDTY